MVLSLTLDQEVFARYDFGRQINFRLYSESDPLLFTQSAFDASSYTTAKVKFYKRHGDRAFFFRDVERALSVVGTLAMMFEVDVVWDTQASGIGHFSFDASNRPTIQGTMWVEVELQKTGEQTSSELRKVYIQASEAA